MPSTYRLCLSCLRFVPVCLSTSIWLCTLSVVIFLWHVLISFYLQLRGETISVYALCGFANLGSIGIMLGGLGAMAPERKKDIAQTVLRAMIAGNVACFMTACIAGKILFCCNIPCFMVTCFQFPDNTITSIHVGMCSSLYMTYV